VRDFVGSHARALCRYGGLLGVLRPEKGEKVETIWVSGAAGAVGSLVGQLAKKISGCTVIGSCGGPDKCKMVTEKFGFDHAIDYKTVKTAEGGIIIAHPSPHDPVLHAIHPRPFGHTVHPPPRLPPCGCTRQTSGSFSRVNHDTHARMHPTQPQSWRPS
jgi:hypothetical protein